MILKNYVITEPESGHLKIVGHVTALSKQKDGCMKEKVIEDSLEYQAIWNMDSEDIMVRALANVLDRRLRMISADGVIWS